MSVDSKKQELKNSQCFLVLLTLISACEMFCLAVFYPSGRPVDEVISLPFASSYGWVLSQSLGVAITALLVSLSILPLAPKYLVRVSATAIMTLPWLYLCDVLAFTWIGERFLSATMAHIAKSLLPALSLHVSAFAVFQALLVVIGGLILSGAGFVLSVRFASGWGKSDDSISAGSAVVVMSMIGLVLAIMPGMNWGTIHEEMRNASSRHPFCAFHVVGFRGVGDVVLGDAIPPRDRLRALESYEAIYHREQNMLSEGLESSLKPPSDGMPGPTDVIVVVVECLRPESISPELMPNLHSFSKKSLLLKRHFSGGNSTCLGMFSLLNGLESIWFRRGVNDAPLYNRLMHQSGYELAFYGGQTDWKVYEMDGFINEKHYDSFHIEDPELPQTDLDAVARTLAFINRTDRDEVKPGHDVSDSLRSAVCYLYGTHSSFRYSDPEYRIFTPEADEGLLIANAPDLKQHFYNRYKNSLRSMDDILAPLLRDDCVVIVTGDHGEPFLDDGTASHGTRLSKYQNMTPAVIYYPGVDPRVIDAPTFHGDLLPTLLAILGIELKGEPLFDGLNVSQVDLSKLQERLFVSGNFIDASSLLVGPWSGEEGKPFGYRIVHDIHRWQAAYLNPVDELGYEMIEPEISGFSHYQDWVQQRFRVALSDHISEEDLLRKCFESSYAEVRMAALNIIATMTEPRLEILEYVDRLARDHDPEIRDRAKELAIQFARDRSWMSLFKGDE